MKVLKFGGTSVSSVAHSEAVTDIVRAAALEAAHSTKHTHTVVVVSALGGTTDALIAAGKAAASGDTRFREMLEAIEKRHLEMVRNRLPENAQKGIISHIKAECSTLVSLCEGIFTLRELSPRTLDRLMATGEWLASLIVAAAFTAAYATISEVQTMLHDTRTLIRTDSSFGNAVVDFPHTNATIRQRILQNVAFTTNAQHTLHVVGGFIAADAHGVTTTLGRGGSDYTAAIFAAALQATALEIWTDVSGMMTADPRLVPNARPIAHISYQEAMELSYFGAKVIYPPTIQPVMGLGIPVWVKNTFAPHDAGTVIAPDAPTNANVVQGISSINKVALLRLEGSGMIGIPGFSARLFTALAKARINVILITQSSSEHSISVAIDAGSSEGIQRATDAANDAFAYEIAAAKLQPVEATEGLSIVAVVGDNMKNHPGISGRMFSALGRNGVNIYAIAQGSSEKNISAVVAYTDVRKAINVLHEAFFEEFYDTVRKEINLFVVGTGNVGRRLLEQIAAQREYLANRLRLQVRVMAVANSRQMMLANTAEPTNTDSPENGGIPLNTWHEALPNAEAMHVPKLLEYIFARNLRNAIFVDNTSAASVAAVYPALLQKSIAVVAANKIAASQSYAEYRKLKDLATAHNTSFLFETNVGAGLPVINTLNDLMQSGDRIHRIEAVLSGTLNFVWNNYDTSRTFADVVRQAEAEGYTEPDPRTDLSGTDVARKILILAREAGYAIEFEAVRVLGFVPDACMSPALKDKAAFYRSLEENEAHFANLYNNALAHGCKLKFVAQLTEEGEASVALREISREHDFFHLYGKDNVVLFYTQRYADQPLVIKGAGAGAEVTAAGIFADIIRAARR